MINRRRLNTMLGLAGAGLMLPSTVKGQAVTTVKLANGSGFVDAQFIYNTCGQHKLLNYYREEGLELEFVNVAGALMNFQALVTGQVDFGAVPPVGFLELYAKNPGMDVSVVYAWLRQPIWVAAVKSDSPIKTLQDLKGKTIGMRNQSDTAYYGVRVMLSEIGLDPDKDVEWVPVGDPGPAAQAISKGRADAPAYLDTGAVRIELTGIPLRYLPNSPGANHVFGKVYAVRKSQLAERRDTFVRFLRAVAKSTAFAWANPETAIKMHWELCPETKPRGKSDEEAMREALAVVFPRKDMWIAADWQSDKRMGGMTREEWQAQVAYFGLAGQIKDPGPVFTTDLLDDINKFDRAAIEAKAKSLKL